MNLILPHEPFILPVPHRENSGVDFLGLRQVNLDLMAELLPGINNVTHYIRPFSLLAWIYWKFHDLCAREGEEPTSGALRLFRERIETLFTWGARIHDPFRIPGKDAAPPKAQGHVSLTFEAWGRVQSSTSLIAALWYGPASKTVGGLGFLEPVRAGFFHTVGNGTELALALDGVLRGNPALYKELLDTLATVEADEAAARSLWDLWGVKAPTPREQRAFRAGLFSEQSVGSYGSPLGRRSSTLALARTYLRRTGKGENSETIRRGMFFASLPAGASFELPPSLATANARWVTLQIRQLQRLALEAMMAWCERQILSGAKESRTISNHAAEALRLHKPNLTQSGTIAAALSSYDERLSSFDDYLALAQTDPALSPFDVMDDIIECLSAGDDRALAVAFHALLVCASVVSCLPEVVKAELTMGGPQRISLANLRRTLVALGDLPLTGTIEYVLEALVVSQHFATAVNRFDGQKQRLRFSIEETGLKSLVGAPWRPNVTEDRLVTALDLSSACGILAKQGDDLYAATD